MKLAISNIAWQKSEDEIIYNLMKQYGFTGLEIAPTRLIEDRPYDNLESARVLGDTLRNIYGISIPSMQSILFGKTERLFANVEERASLLLYLKKAVDFAVVLQCGNLVFGSPKNRCVGQADHSVIGKQFFHEIGEYAETKGTVVSMEANPVIYATDYINFTQQAADLVRDVDCCGFRVNLDIGTMIANQEMMVDIAPIMDIVQHVHISEPYLATLQKRRLHEELADVIGMSGYLGYVSIEMKRDESDPIGNIERALHYVRQTFTGD